MRAKALRGSDRRFHNDELRREEQRRKKKTQSPGLQAAMREIAMAVPKGADQQNFAPMPGTPNP